MQLLEREAQLAALAEYAEEARAGHGRLVLVAGEAGVGKSALLEQFEAALPDGQWAWGACDGLFTPRPLAPLYDLATTLGGNLQSLVQAGAARDELFTALLAQITESDRLTVLAIEDVHWADEATLDLLRYLGRRIRSARALLLVSFRDEGFGASDLLRVALGELATQRSTRRVTLPTLTAQAVEVLARGSDLAPAELHRLTGGNAFFVTEVLRPGAGALPASARDAVLSHLAGLSEPARQVVEVAALIGARVEPSLLVQVTGAGPEVIDELIGCGVLTGDASDSSGGGRMRFRHEISRLAVEQSIGPHRRGPIHHEILEALRDNGCDDDARLAFHAEGAGSVELVRVHAAAAAARASVAGSHRDAAAHYERAVRHSSGTEPQTTAPLYDALAAELTIIDRWADCADACARAVALWREAGDGVHEGRSLGVYSRALWRLCRGPESDLALEQSLHLLEPLGPGAELAAAVASLASQRAEQGRVAEALDLVERARAMAVALDLSDVVIDATDTEGWALDTAGDDGITPITQALELALERDLPVDAGRAYINLYTLHRAALRIPEAERAFADGVAYCDAHEVSTFGNCLRGERSHALLQMGRWDEADELAQTVLARVGSSPLNRLIPQIAAGRLRARRGEDGVWERLDEGTAPAVGLAHPVYTVLARLARAEARWLAGENRSASEEIALAEAQAPWCSPSIRSEIAGWSHRITGRQPDPALGPLIEPYASQVAGDWARAAELWDEIACPYDAALALLASDDEAALREAFTRLEKLGAAPAAQLARLRMRELGVRSVPAGARASTRAHPAGLTKREREVLELIVEGQTNDEISGRLFISVRTVDHHVSAVLGKLGVESRRVAATEAVRLGLVGSRR